MPDGNIIVEDISSEDVLPITAMIPIAVVFKSHGLVDGYAWVEEQHIIKLPKWLSMLFFMFIKPVITKKLFVHLDHEDGTEVEFEVEYDQKLTIPENIAKSEFSSSINDVWILRK